MSSKSDRGTKRPLTQKPDPSSVVREPSGPPAQQDCGCTEQRFNDETVDTRPCMPHAFQQMADSLISAGNAIGYVGLALDEQRKRRQEMEKLNEDVESGIESGDIT